MNSIKAWTLAGFLVGQAFWWSVIGALLLANVGQRDPSPTKLIAYSVVISVMVSTMAAQEKARRRMVELDREAIDHLDAALGGQT